MARAGQRKCLNCNELFDPDARNQDRQHYCAKPDCRHASKAASHAAWLAKPANSSYFCGPVHITRVQAWRAAHPGYSRSKPVKRPAPKALQDCSVSQVNDSIEETCIRTEIPEPSAAPALQDIWNASGPILAGLVAHLFDLTLQEDIDTTTRRLVQLGSDLINRSHYENRQTSAAPCAATPGTRSI